MSFGNSRSSLPARPTPSASGSSGPNSRRQSSVETSKVPTGTSGRKSSKGGDGRILVAVRMRPLNNKEIQEGSKFIWTFRPQHMLELEDDGCTPTGKTWVFDDVFAPDVDTQSLFEMQCKPIVQSALEGYNGTIFAYGQTSSGKTYTLMGNPDTNPGVSILAMHEIFDHIGKNSHMEWDTHASYIEIYNESVTDLLQRDARKGKNLKIVEEKTLGSSVKDLTELTVLNRQHCLDLVLDGEKRRTYAHTNMNEISSRSHTLFRLRVEGRTRQKEQSERVCSDHMRNVASEFLQMQNRLMADHASLYLVDRTTDELFIQEGEITLRLPMSQGIAGAVATTGETINIVDAYEDERFHRSIDMKTGYRTKSILSSAIHGAPDEQVIGVVQFINKMSPENQGFDIHDEQLVQELTQRLGPLISSAQRHATTSSVSLLNIVDLAGSERAAKSGATGDILKQAGYINQSLHTLGACIAILSEGKKQHVPFRDSKLTQLLSSSLGGNAKTCLICAASPASSNRAETLSTLQFASRAKNVVNRFYRNILQDQTELVAVYQAEIAKLRAQLEQAPGSKNASLNYAPEADHCYPAPAIMEQLREKLDQFATDVAEAETLVNQPLVNESAGYRIQLKPMVASEGGRNEDPKLVVSASCLSQMQIQASRSPETWIAEQEFYSRLDWLRKQNSAAMLSMLAKNGRNAWDSAGSAVGSGSQLAVPNRAEGDLAALEKVMTRAQERKYWQTKHHRVESDLLLLKAYVEHISTEVKRTSLLTKKIQLQKNVLTTETATSSLWNTR